MISNFNQRQKNVYNDYTLVKQNPSVKLLSSHERCMSSGSIYYQNNFSRKKLTVTSRDNSKCQLKGDYMISDNASSINSSNRKKVENIPYNNSYMTQDYNNINSSQSPELLTNSRIQRNKLKRSISPSPMTPTKVLKLKRSIIKQNNQSNNVLLRSQQRNMSKRRYESENVSPMRLNLQSQGKLLVPCQIKFISSQGNKFDMDNIKKEMIGLFNIKVLDLKQKIRRQDEIILSLQRKLQQNTRRILQKQKIIQDLKANRQKSTTFYSPSTNPSFVNKKIEDINLSTNYSFINKKIEDIQSNHSIILQSFHNFKLYQSQIQNQIQYSAHFITSIIGWKLKNIQSQLSNFIKEKSQIILLLGSSFNNIDNKLIGRTQALKQTLAQLKTKIKQIQDSCTHKDTKDTTSRDKSYEDVSETFNFSNKNIKHFQNKLKQLTLANTKQNTFQKIKCQDSLDYSLTSYDQNTNLNKNMTRNIYYDDNFNQIQDVSMVGFSNPKNQLSNLTDDFYYPGSTNGSSRNSSKNISPILLKKQSNEYFGNELNNKKNSFIKKQKNESPKHLQNKATQHSIQKQNKKSQSPFSELQKQTIVKISNQAINKKIQSIKQLIDDKKVSSCQQIQKGQVRCFLDKTGYLKYTDSKTFVFDKKGNLINCTQGQYWFLVTKGLIYGKDDQESRTMSFMQYNE